MPYPVLKYYHAPWRYCFARLRSQTTKDFKKDIELITNPSIILEILQKKLNEYFGCEIKTVAEASKKINY